MLTSFWNPEHQNKLAYTTGFHTRFAEYAEARIPLSFVKTLVYRLLRWFHKNSTAILAPTKTVSLELESRGFKNVVTWTRGVDRETFKPFAKQHTTEMERPVLVYVGRIAVEKGIEDFLKLESPGTKLAIGDGPLRHVFEEKYPEVVFTGYLFGEDLARKIAIGDVFVFPSKTDTFGLVMLEAMACGLPVAAYPVMGPVDVVDDGYSGALEDDLNDAVSRALKLDRNNVIEYASRFGWRKTAEQFFDNLAPITTGR